MRVCVIYNVASITSANKADEIAHNEIIDTSLQVKKALVSFGHKVNLLKVSEDMYPRLKKDFDIVFNLAEDVLGNIVSETNVAKKLEEYKIPFTGSDSNSLQVCIDKEKTKKCLLKKGVLTPSYRICKKGEDAKGMNYPLIVKPVNMDGSIGIDIDSVVNDEKSLLKKIKYITETYKQASIVEEYIEGRELNVALIGNGKDIEALPVSEVIFNYPKGIPRILSYDAKWLVDTENYKNSVGKTAELSATEYNEISSAAKNAFIACGCSDYARVDIRSTGSKHYVIEINSKPCISPEMNAFIRSAKAAGLSYEGLIYKIFKTSCNRYGLLLEA
ncbi:MAG: ATP-grasp domain-containing protein [archaeon]